MYPYIVCYCGRSIGDLYDAYKLMRLRKYQKLFAASDMQPDVAGGDPTLFALAGIAVPVGDILDQLGLKAECCRTRMISQVEFGELA